MDEKVMVEEGKGGTRVFFRGGIVEGGGDECEGGDQDEGGE